MIHQFERPGADNGGLARRMEPRRRRPRAPRPTPTASRRARIGFTALVLAGVLVVALPDAGAQNGGSSSTRSSSKSSTASRKSTATPTTVLSAPKQGTSSGKSSSSKKSSSKSSSGKSSSSKSSSGTKSSSGKSGSKKSNSKVDVLKASQRDVRRTVDTLVAQMAAQQAVFDTESAQATSAETAAQQATDKATAAAAKVTAARAEVRRYAVGAFVRPPASGSLAVLSLRRADEASYANEVLSIVADDRASVVDELEKAEKSAANEKSKAVAASTAARGEADAARAELDRLNGLRAEQDALARSLDERLDQALAEASAVRQVDASAGDKIASSEVALRSSAPAASATTRRSAKPTTTTTEPKATSPAPKPKPTPTAPPTTTPPTTTAKPKPASRRHPRRTSCSGPMSFGSTASGCTSRSPAGCSRW